MKITINGKPEEIGKEIPLLDYIKKKNIDPETVVVELNFNIIGKDSLKTTIIKGDDKLEIFRLVGGG